MRFFSLFSSERPVLWFLHITCVFSFFLFISLLIYSTSFTTTKYTILNERAVGNSSFKIHILRNVGELAFVSVNGR